MDENLIIKELIRATLHNLLVNIPLDKLNPELAMEHFGSIFESIKSLEARIAVAEEEIERREKQRLEVWDKYVIGTLQEYNSLMAHYELQTTRIAVAEKALAGSREDVDFLEGHLINESKKLAVAEEEKKDLRDEIVHIGTSCDILESKLAAKSALLDDAVGAIKRIYRSVLGYYGTMLYTDLAAGEMYNEVSEIREVIVTRYAETQKRGTKKERCRKYLDGMIDSIEEDNAETQKGADDVKA